MKGMVICKLSYSSLSDAGTNREGGSSAHGAYPGRSLHNVEENFGMEASRFLCFYSEDRFSILFPRA